MATVVPHTNICSKFEFKQGDGEKGFRESDFVFEETFCFPTGHHCKIMHTDSRREKCRKSCQSQVLTLAAPAFGVKPEDLEVANGEIHAKGGDKKMTVSVAIRARCRSGLTVLGRNTYYISHLPTRLPTEICLEALNNCSKVENYLSAHKELRALTEKDLSQVERGLKFVDHYVPVGTGLIDKLALLLITIQ